MYSYSTDSFEKFSKTKKRYREDEYEKVEKSKKQKKKDYSRERDAKRGLDES